MKNDLGLLDLDDDDIEQQMEDILAADAITYREILQAATDMSWNEKAAIGLHAFWLLNQTRTQLCNIQPTYGSFPPTVDSTLILVRKLSPQSLVELANEILLEDWELGSV